VATHHARHFSDAGLSVVRDRDVSIVFSHGPQHRRLYSHGHLHADAGSFELEIAGTPLVVDAGTHVYFADASSRAYFKGARAHNAPLVDDVEPMRSLEPFKWESVATGEALGFGVEGDVSAIGTRRRIAGADGVAIDHVRALVACAGTVLVFDALRTRDNAPVVLRAHLARMGLRTPTPRGTASVDGARVSLTDPRRFARVLEAFSDGPLNVDLIDDPGDKACWYSSRYGSLEHGVAVRISAEFETRAVVLSAIRLPDVAVSPVQLDSAETLATIESHHGRRLVRVQFDPFSVVVSGRVIAGQGAKSAGTRASRPRSATPDWLDELAAGS
jgi:hypothetical protein